jgi:hypothetical protein
MRIGTATLSSYQHLVKMTFEDLINSVERGALREKMPIPRREFRPYRPDGLCGLAGTCIAVVKNGNGPIRITMLTAKLATSMPLKGRDHTIAYRADRIDRSGYSRQAQRSRAPHVREGRPPTWSSSSNAGLCAFEGNAENILNDEQLVTQHLAVFRAH